MSDLELFYRFIVVTHAPTAVFAKMSLAAALVLVHAGNQKPGYNLLTSVFLVHFLVALFMAMGSEGAVWVISMASLGIAAAAGYALAKEPCRWVVLPAHPGWKALAAAGYLAAFLFPLWPLLTLVRGAIVSPMAALPHQTLLVLLVAVAVSGRRVSRVLAWTAVIAASVLILVDLTAQGNRIMAICLALGVVAAAARLTLAGDTQDTPPSEGEREDAPQAPPPPSPRPMRQAPSKPTPPPHKEEKKAERKKKSREWDLR